jgi:hypothetical protein
MGHSYRFGYLGRSVHVYALDIFHWFVTVDNNHVMRGDDPAQWSTKAKAIQDVYAFVWALAQDEIP